MPKNEQIKLFSNLLTSVSWLSTIWFSKSTTNIISSSLGDELRPDMLSQGQER